MTPQELKAEIKKIHQQVKKAGGHNANEASKLFAQEYELKMEFAKEHGMEALTRALLPKRCPTQKTHKSKGHFYM